MLIVPIVAAICLAVWLIADPEPPKAGCGKGTGGEVAGATIGVISASRHRDQMHQAASRPARLREQTPRGHLPASLPNPATGTRRPEETMSGATFPPSSAR